jgi:hypothetical protein
VRNRGAGVVTQQAMRRKHRMRQLSLVRDHLCRFRTLPQSPAGALLVCLLLASGLGCSGYSKRAANVQDVSTMTGHAPPSTKVVKGWVEQSRMSGSALFAHVTVERADVAALISSFSRDGSKPERDAGIVARYIGALPSGAEAELGIPKYHKGQRVAGSPYGIGTSDGMLLDGVSGGNEVDVYLWAYN